MLNSMSSDTERQEDEILAISSILDTNEFRYEKRGSIVQCDFNIFPVLKGNKIKVTNKSEPNDKTSTHSELRVFSVDHLPPIRLHINTSNNYPSREPPKFVLTISWLPLWEISFICQKLDEIWEENRGNEILFLWLDFLKNDILSFLGINETLDISFMYMVYINAKYYIQSGLMSLCDPRAINRALYLNPVKFLNDYSRDQHKVQFEKDFYICSICFEKYSGKECVELEICKHIYCKECMQQYITLKIEESAVKYLICPEPLCKAELTYHDVKSISPNMTSKYENILLEITLNTMSDITHCPRRTCQHPVVKDMDETLTICDKCNYSFCSYCNKAYHGVAPCEMESDEIAKLIASYKNADKEQKKLLEKRYGRKQIQVIAEKHLTNEYMKDNTKRCPSCQAFIEKIDGCNKMQCTHCQTAFCWICGMLILEENPYDHFAENGKTCYGRLFEGMQELNLEDINIIDNVLWFNEQIEHIV